MSGSTQQDHTHQLKSAMSDDDIERLLKNTEREDEATFCLDDDLLDLDFNSDTYYIEVTHKKRCLNGKD